MVATAHHSVATRTVSAEPLRGVNVHVMSQRLADMIAAGEVVERPASVVKELLENALDAQAGHITVNIEDGGMRLIEVEDDGAGMVPEDAGLAVLRHATSKLTDVEGLDKIATFGFRGEALPSIGAVAKLTVRTKVRGAASGTLVHVEGGGTATLQDCGCPEGTRVRVEDLFFNVPARRKFMKTPATEQQHIAEAVARAALAFPAIGFYAHKDGKPWINLPPTHDPAVRIARALSVDLFGRLFPVTGAGQGVACSGFASSPEANFNTARNIYAYVNQRFVTDKIILGAIKDAYREVLPSGRHPAAVLFLTVEPGDLDVNVHPQKLEVRFRDAASIRRAVLHALAGMLRASPWVGGTEPVRRMVLEGAPGTDAGSAAGVPTSVPVSAVALPPLPGTGNRALDALLGAAPRAGVLRPVLSGFTTGAMPAPPRPLPGIMAPAAEAPGLADSAAGATSGPAPGFFSQLKVIGRLGGTYVLCQSPNGLAAIDQHAAHERIVYGRLMKAFAERKVARQVLLFPVTLTLGAAEIELVRASGPTLEELGFVAEPFGAATVVVKEVPEALKDADPGALLQELVGALASHRGDDEVKLLAAERLSTCACHAAIRANDPLSEAECYALLAEMDRSDYASRCPHGRPVVAEFGWREIEGWFKRH